jgi:hypothetical protein
MAATADTATRAAAVTPLPVRTEIRITGLTYDGGYAEYMIAPSETLAAIPAGLEAIEAAPLMCAGITIFNALRRAGPPARTYGRGVRRSEHQGAEKPPSIAFPGIRLAAGQLMLSCGGGAHGGANVVFRELNPDSIHENAKTNPLEHSTNGAKLTIQGQIILENQRFRRARLIIKRLVALAQAPTPAQ